MTDYFLYPTYIFSVIPIILLLILICDAYIQRREHPMGRLSSKISITVWYLMDQAVRPIEIRGFDIDKFDEIPEEKEKIASIAIDITQD